MWNLIFMVGAFMLKSGVDFLSIWKELQLASPSIVYMVIQFLKASMNIVAIKSFVANYRLRNKSQEAK